MCFNCDNKLNTTQRIYLFKKWDFILKHMICGIQNRTIPHSSILPVNIHIMTWPHTSDNHHFPRKPMPYIRFCHINDHIYIYIYIHIYIYIYIYIYDHWCDKILYKALAYIYCTSETFCCLNLVNETLWLKINYEGSKETQSLHHKPPVVIVSEITKLNYIFMAEMLKKLLE